MERLRVLQLAALGCWLPMAVSCGGGAWFSWCGNCDDGEPPSVSLAAPVDSVPPGQSVHLVAAASDADGIDEVAFYRVDAGTPTLQGRDRIEPWEQDVFAPADGRSELKVFARATDRGGRQSDSAVLTIEVTR